jgi:maltose O-acetyltransferase
MNKDTLAGIDETVNSFLGKSISILPGRWIKFLAYFYPDARIRKMCLGKMSVYMGEDTFANYGLKVVVNSENEEYKIIIGDRVSIAPNVTIISESSPNNSPHLANIAYVRENLIKDEKVIVEDDVWIGASVTILPGVKIGKGAIIGAGAVVTKNVEPYTVVAGIPAKVIRTLQVENTLNT